MNSRSLHQAPLATALVFAACAAALVPARAGATVALAWTAGGGLGFATGDVTVGWSFTATTPFTVTDLGYWDFQSDGLATAHAVDIWTSAGVLQVSGTVPAGTAGVLLAGVRYTPVTPTTLPAGNYTIGAFFPNNSADVLQATASSIITDPTFTYGGSRGANTAGGIAFPAGNAPGNTSGIPNGYFGPDFQFTPTPEPTSAALLTLGAVSLLGKRRRNTGHCARSSL